MNYIPCIRNISNIFIKQQKYAKYTKHTKTCDVQCAQQQASDLHAMRTKQQIKLGQAQAQAAPAPSYVHIVYLVEARKLYTIYLPYEAH